LFAMRSTEQEDRSMRVRGGIGASALALLTVAGLAGTSHAQGGLPGVVGEQDCQPGIDAEYAQDQANYDTLLAAVLPEVTALTADLQSLSAETYPELLTHAQTIAGRVPNGRVVLTLPDGTVVVDTGRSNNTYENFQAKTINENHNSRLAIFAAQHYPCSVGIERKFSTTSNAFEDALALRLGDHLSSQGTIRISN
jgi:hypothetical protein